jgi:exonuclease III
MPFGPNLNSSIVADSDILSRSDQRLQDRMFIGPKKSLLSHNEVRKRHKRALNSLAEITRRGLPSTPRAKEWLTKRVPSKGDEIRLREWRHTVYRRETRKNQALGHAPPAKLANQLLSPEKGYVGDAGSAGDTEETETSLGIPLGIGATMPLSLTTELTKPVRFCLFNTGRLTTREVWNVMRKRLTPETLDGLVRVKSIQQPNGNPRTDIWVEARVATQFPKAMYLRAPQRRRGVKIDNRMPLYKLGMFWIPNSETKRWRIAHYTKWVDRHPERVTVKPVPRQIALTSVLTYNVNGWNGKKLEVITLMAAVRAGIVAIQETLLSEDNYRMHVPGYTVYERMKSKNFRGQALLISQQYSSYEVSTSKENYFIHVKVSGFRGKEPWHIIAIYYPSGGNYRKERTKCLNRVLSEYSQIITKDPEAKVLILGDHNIKREELTSRIKPAKTGLKCLSVKGSALTFHRPGLRWTDVDNMVVSPNANDQLGNAKVIRNMGTSSDHFPLIAKLKPEKETTPLPKPPKFRYDKNLVKCHGKRLIFSNRWTPLKSITIEDEEDLDEGAITFCEAVNTAADDLGIRRQVLDRKFTYCRKLKSLLNGLAKFRERYEVAVKKNSADKDRLLRSYKMAQTTCRKAIRKRKADMHKAEVERVTQLHRANEAKDFHRWETSVTRSGKATSNSTPVQAKDGSLLTEDKDIRERTCEYYRELNQDDPKGLSGNENFWKGKQTDRREEELPGINRQITWQEVLLVIRNMALGTAPGHDGIPSDMYKKLLREECHQHLRNQGIEVGDGIYVALPAKELPEDPVTPMGQQLFKVLTAMWDQRRQPESWAKVVNVTVPKTGDPTNLKNHRGISLIVVAMKIMTTFLANRLSAALESEDVLMKEQGGFRSHEEAIAQFITLAEIVRRRRISGKKTLVVFVDFLKAFDKVMHEALFEKLEAVGVRGQFLELIKDIYRTSKACLRVNGECSEYYDMLRGTRQGCPLSPILFITYINDFLKYVPKGVDVPGVKKDNHCPGLFFADDVAGLTTSTEMAHQFLAGVTKWSNEWQMPMGAPKCGVMLIGGTDEEQRELEKEEFKVDGQKVEVVTQYKYLGIVITPNLGDLAQTDEIAHCKTLAKRVKQAVDIRRGFLRDKKYPLDVKLAVISSKIIPLGIYGGEWVGFSQRRTNIIQAQVNVALRLILQSSTKSNLHSVKTMCWELGIPTIEERMADLRVRLYRKAPTLRTWIAVLVDPENRLTSRKRVWSSQTLHGLNTMKDPQDRCDKHWMWDCLKQEGKVKAYPHDMESDDPDYPKKERQEVKLRIIQRSLKVDVNERHDVQATKHYLRAGYAMNRQWIKSAAIFPELTEGSIWLARLRTKSWWTTKRRYETLKRKGGDLSYLKPRECPCCERELNEPEDTHILMKCPRWKEQRETYLGKILKFLRAEIRKHHNGALELSMADDEITMRLLGGEFIKGRMFLEEYPNSQSDPNTEALDLFSRGWGGRQDYVCSGLAAHGYVFVASFLAKVMPLHKAYLFPTEEDNTNRIAYKTTSEEESPMKRRNMQLVVKRPGHIGESPCLDRQPQRGANLDFQAEARESMAHKLSTRRRKPHALDLSSTSEGDDSPDPESQISDF